MLAIQNSTNLNNYLPVNSEAIEHFPTKKQHLDSGEAQLIYVKNYSYQNGDSYEGGTFLGKRQGFGKYYNNDGSLRYEGEFHNDQREGQGKCFDAKGVCRYEGDFINNVGEGQGKMFSPNSRISYDGEFKKGKMHGKGKSYNSLTVKFGDGKKREFFYLSYLGEFAENKKTENGKSYHVNGVIRAEELKNASSMVKDFKLCKNMYGEIVGFE